MIIVWSFMLALFWSSSICLSKYKIKFLDSLPYVFFNIQDVYIVSLYVLVSTWILPIFICLYNSEFQLIHELCLYVLSASQRTELIRATLATLHAFLSWIPLGYIFESPLVSFLTIMCYSFSPCAIYDCDSMLSEVYLPYLLFSMLLMLC